MPISGPRCSTEELQNRSVQALQDAVGKHNLKLLDSDEDDAGFEVGMPAALKVTGLARQNASVVMPPLQDACPEEPPCAEQPYIQAADIHEPDVHDNIIVFAIGRSNPSRLKRIYYNCDDIMADDIAVVMYDVLITPCFATSKLT